MKLDVLAFGIHPDDVELSCGGTMAKQKSLGYKTGICDLTRGEMGTRGTPELRLKEAEAASKILNLDMRINLNMEDVWMLDNKGNMLEIIKVIRKYKPTIVLCNSHLDRHPDHSKGYEIVKKAVFYSGLSKIETEYDGVKQEHYRPKNLYNYIQFKYLKPDFAVDITGFMDIKMKAIMAYSSQFFNPESDEPSTFISDENFLKLVQSKDLAMGKVIDVNFAEGFQVERYLGVNDLMDLL